MHFTDEGPTQGELPLHLPGDRGAVMLRWQDTKRGRLGTLWYGDRQLVISTSEYRNHNGERSLREEVGVSEFDCRDLIDSLPPDGGVLAPKPARGLKGVALVNRSREPLPGTKEWVLDGGRSATGAIYNTYLIAHMKIELEIDLENMLAYYFETSSWDDG